MAIILALEQALDKYEKLHSYPKVKVEIFSDSKYAIGCMTEWIYKWSGNGWTNATGNPVANQDLIKEASDLEDRLKTKGRVKYTWIPRAENKVADRSCNDALDEQERQQTYYDSSDSSDYW
jgi:ribonuclease HI